ncbi:MAG: hypothetical protein IJ496_05265 [Ruminococcus sp.]|nr:hypothetical protein [Ruminococcus sp.]
MKKMISMLTAAVMLACSAAFPVSAEETVAAETVSYSDAVPFGVSDFRANAFLTISSGTATCTSTAYGDSSVTRITATQYLQKETSTNNWSAIASWSATADGSSFSQKNTKSGLGSGTYRVWTVYNVYRGTTTAQRVEAYSNEVTIS